MLWYNLGEHLAFKFTSLVYFHKIINYSHELIPEIEINIMWYVITHSDEKIYCAPIVNWAYGNQSQLLAHRGSYTSVGKKNTKQIDPQIYM